MTNNKFSFLAMTFKLWTSDFGDMDDFMECLWALMLRYNIRWIETPDVETSSVTEGMDTAELFAFNLNCEGYNSYEAFVRFCTAYMDFSKMDQPQTLSFNLNLLKIN